jgi:hypothetical protein
MYDQQGSSAEGAQSPGDALSALTDSIKKMRSGEEGDAPDILMGKELKVH